MRNSSNASTGGPLATAAPGSERRPGNSNVSLEQEGSHWRKARPADAKRPTVWRAQS